MCSLHILAVACFRPGEGLRQAEVQDSSGRAPKESLTSQIPPLAELPRYVFCRQCVVTVVITAIPGSPPDFVPEEARSS